MTGAGVLTAGGSVVVRAIAGAVVVVVVVIEEIHLAPIPIAQEGFAFGRTAAERHRDGVARAVGAAHRIAPVRRPARLGRPTVVAPTHLDLDTRQAVSATPRVVSAHHYTFRFYHHGR